MYCIFLQKRTKECETLQIAPGGYKIPKYNYVQSLRFWAHSLIVPKH